MLALKEAFMATKKNIMEKRKTANPINKKSRKRSLSKKEAEAALRKGAQEVKPSDVENVLKKSEEIEHKFQTAGPLSQFIEELKLLLGIVQDYWSGSYKEIPYWTIAAIVAALLYVLSPIDIIPDFIPVVGYVDDAAIVAACIAMVRQDLHMYKQWKASNA